MRKLIRNIHSCACIVEMKYEVHFKESNKGTTFRYARTKH